MNGITKILSDARRRLSQAERNRSLALAGIRTQERVIAGLSARHQDTKEAEALLAHFRAALERDAAEVAAAQAAFEELRSTPAWRLADG